MTTRTLLHYVGLMLIKLLYNHWVLGRAQFKPWGIKMNSVPYMIEVVLTNIKLKLHLWEKNIIRARDYKNHRIFTLRCIGLNLIPVSIRLKPVRSNHNISRSARKFIENAERQLMQDRVRTINKTIQASKDQGNLSRAKLASMVTQVDLDRCSNFIEKVGMERFNQVKNGQVRKLHILYSKNNNEQANNNRDRDNRFPLGVNANSTDSNRQVVRHGNDKQTSNSNIDSKWVINLSETELIQAQKSVLNKGPNYAVSPNNIPNLDNITAIETVCSKLKEEDVAKLRGEIDGILRKGKTPKPNLNKEERIALNQLRKDKDRVILTADKAVEMVVLDKEDYNNKARDLLNNQHIRKYPKDPTNRIKSQLITKLRKNQKGQQTR